MTKSITKYRVRISFVDDSYWDDGSRWASETFKFNKRQEAINFANNAIAKGIVVDGQSGKVDVRSDKRDVTIFKDTSSEIDF
jgi:hypothetical protein